MPTRKSQPGTAHRIRFLSVNGKFFDNLHLDFSQGLNCLIGGRGAGKTTILELIRFALDEMPEDKAARDRVNALIERNLDFGRVELGIQTAAGLSYIISRSLKEEPVVLTEDRKSTDLILKSGSLFKADIFSQNEVETIADRSDSQLELIDSFDHQAIAEDTARANRLVLEIAGVAKDILQAQARIKALRDETGELRTLEEELKGLTASGTGDAKALNTAHEVKALRDREKRALHRLIEKLGSYGKELRNLQGALLNEANATVTDEMAAGPNKAILQNVLKTVHESGQATDQHIEAALAVLTKCWEELQKQSKALTTAHGAQEMAFRGLIEKHQAAIGQSTQRAQKEKRRNELLAMLQDMKAAEEQLALLEARRAKLLQQLTEVRDARFERRQQICRSLTESLQAADVRVGISQYGDKRLYREKLDELLKGSRVPESAKEKLVDNLFPAELVHLIRTQDDPALVDQAELTLNMATRVVAALDIKEDLHELETVELLDLPRIELNDNGNWKESRDLSTGQKCTAILPILLMDSEKPLLIDQPEDNLDNRYVSEKVVRTIAMVKKRRQLIFATHNPNLLVLGEADRVFVMVSDGKAARKKHKGSVDECKDEIVSLLEGGKEAFQLRAERYKK